MQRRSILLTAAGAPLIILASWLDWDPRGGSGWDLSHQYGWRWDIASEGGADASGGLFTAPVALAVAIALAASCLAVARARSHSARGWATASLAMSSVLSVATATAVRYTFTVIRYDSGVTSGQVVLGVAAAVAIAGTSLQVSRGQLIRGVTAALGLALVGIVLGVVATA